VRFSLKRPVAVHFFGFPVRRAFINAANKLQSSMTQGTIKPARLHLFPAFIDALSN
jgi:hypothetical protein